MKLKNLPPVEVKIQYLSHSPFFGVYEDKSPDFDVVVDPSLFISCIKDGEKISIISSPESREKIIKAGFEINVNVRGIE